VASACAQAGSDPDAQPPGADGPATSVDAAVDPDAPVAVDPDAPVIDAPSPVDAPPGTPDATVADAAVADAPLPDAAIPPADAALPDAMPPPIDGPLPDASCGWVELLSNANFDAGNTVWSTTTNGSQVIRMYGAGYPWPPQSGDWAALLGGADYADQTLSQQVTVPAGATALRFVSWECFVTEETTALFEYDTVDIELQTTGGTTLESLAHVSNLDVGATCGWSTNTINASSSYAGQTIQLHFAVLNDVSNISSFGFDTLALEAYVCN